MIFDILEKIEMYIPVCPQLRAVADALDHDDIYDKAPGLYTTPDENVSYRVSQYVPSSGDVPFVFHKKHTEVHIVLSGSELFSTTWRELKDEAGSYNASTDEGSFSAEPICALQAQQGRFAVFFAGEPFKTGVSPFDGRPVKKVVFSIKEE